METTPKTAEEMLNEFPDKYFWDDNRNLENVPAVEVLNLMKRYALQVGEAVRAECAKKATVFIPSHPHLHGTKNIDKDSILSVDVNQFIK